MIYAYGFFSVVKLPKFCKEVHDVMYNANRTIFADRDDLDELIEEVKTIFNAKNLKRVRLVCAYTILIMATRGK